MLGKKDNIIRESIPIGKLDSATCQKLRGFVDETGTCRILLRENPQNPDEVVLEAVKGYIPSPHQKPVEQ